jgi:hypothetical protein
MSIYTLTITDATYDDLISYTGYIFGKSDNQLQLYNSLFDDKLQYEKQETIILTKKKTAKSHYYIVETKKHINLIYFGTMKNILKHLKTEYGFTITNSPVNPILKYKFKTATINKIFVIDHDDKFIEELKNNIINTKQNINNLNKEKVKIEARLDEIYKETTTSETRLDDIISNYKKDYFSSIKTPIKRKPVVIKECSNCKKIVYDYFAHYNESGSGMGGTWSC